MALRDVQAVVTITTNATKAIDDGKKLRETYKATLDIIKQFRKDGKIDTPEGKELLKLADDLQAKIKALVTGMKLIEGVANNLSNKTGKDINRALRETSKEFNKTANDTDAHKRKLEQLRQSVEKFKREMSDRKGLTMSFQDAQKQLSNLNRTSLDNLNKGLAAIKSELAKPLPNKWRQQLEQMQAQYQAAIAVRNTPITQRPVTSMNAAQLKAEQSAITSALAATTGVKGFEQQAANYKKRLQEITQELKNMSTAEQQANERAKQLQATQQAAQTVQAVYRGQKVSLEQLQQAYQTLQARADKYAGVNPAKVQQAMRQMDMLRKKMQEVGRATLSDAELQKRLGNTGKYSVTQLQEAYQALEQRLNNLRTSETQAIATTRKQMQMLQRDINRATGQVTGFAKAWQTAKQNIMMYVGVFAIVNKIKSTLSSLVSQNKALSDSMANIRKVSQWANKDVVALTENLAKIDTRNTITTLQNLAYQGAKLGIGQYGVEGLTGFVRAAEQVQTALGEDLGEEALPALAKLTEVMGLIPKFGVEEAMQKAGSAIYQLGATSTATGKNIVEFSKRLMGLANVSGISADQLLGLGSAADSMALMPEVAATAFNKLFNSIHGNTEGIAKAVGLAKEELTDLLYEGRTMDALVKVFEKMQTMSMKELEGRGVFKELGSDGARLTNVMITMANKVDMLKSHLEVSNEAFSEGKAVINEYMIQQETAAAYFERASNIWAKAFVNPEGVDIVKQLAQEWYNVSYEMTHSATTMASIKLTLELIAGAIKTVITYLPTLVQMMMFYGIGSVLQNMLVQYRAITVAINAAGGAQARFNALLKTNAIALATTAVLMLVGKMWEMHEASKATNAELERQKKIFSDAASEAIQAYREQAEALKKYEDALKKSNSTEDERNEIIRKFKSEFGSYLEKLGIEIKTYEDMESALHRVNKELKDKAYYETGKKLEQSYVGDAKQERTVAISKYMQAAQKYNIPTTLMEDILEGKVTDVATAMQRIQQAQQANLPAGMKVIDGRRFGIGSWQDVQAEENKTVGDKVSDFLFGNKTPKATQETTDIYHAVNDLVAATQEVNSREAQVTQFMEQYAGDYSPNISVDGAILNLERLKELNEDKLNEGLNVLREEWKKINDADAKLKAIDTNTAGGSSKNQVLVSQRSQLEAQVSRKDEVQSAMDAYMAQLRSMRGEGYTPPPTKKEINAAIAAEKEALRKDLKDAKEDSDAIISKIEEWYRLQETVITDMQADGRLTKEQAEQVVRTLNMAKNTALRDARLAISGRDTEAWEQTKQQIGQLMLDQGQWSSELLQQILGVSMEGIRRNLARIDAGGGKYGITTTSLKDAIDKNAAGNQREIARLQAKSQQEVEKLLLQYHFVEQAIEGFSDRLAQMDILTETAQSLHNQMVQARTSIMFEQATGGTGLASAAVAEAQRIQLQKQQEQAKKQMAQAFIQSGAAAYAVNPDDVSSLEQWFKAFIRNNEGAYQSWAENFRADFELWENDSATYKSQIQAFYFSLMQTEEEYFDARKKAYNKAKKDFDQMWEVSGKGDAFNSLSQALDLRNRQLKLTGADKGTNFIDQAGFSNLNEDPEIAQSILRMEQAQQELEMLRQVNAQKKLEGDELLAHQQLLHEKEQALADASMSMQEAIMAKINDRISKISEWTTPIENFGSEVGKALYDQWHNGESITSKWQDLLKSMALSWGQTTVSIVKELMIQKLKQRLINKAMQAESIAHEATMTAIQQAGGQSRQLVQQTTGQALVQGEQATNTTLEAQQAAHNATTLSEDVGQAAAETPVNISRAAGKTLANLGWWGIPLIAVITALLNGLLQAALGSSNKSNKSESSSSSATKTKLVSGMLTYDEGNTQSYLGTDGHVYRARQATPPEGVSLVTRPIATTVQGQPALVAERGPEIVIGRRTTRAIQMNEPELLTRLAQYDRHHSGPRLRTFDDGNLADSVPAGLASGNSSEQNSEQNERIAAALDQNTQMMAAFVQMMTTIQRQGIPAHINKYGTGGLIDEVKSGLKFDAKYNR